MKYKRILLKLSGEALMGEKQYGIDIDRVAQYARDIHAVHAKGIEIALVIGGGNIYRGLSAEKAGMDRVQADYMGMLATVINSMEQICEPFIRRRAVRHLEKGRIVIFGAGTGNPYFTTDTAASLRAVEINADVVMKGTRVDGIYSADPLKEPDATRYAEITFDEVYKKNLTVMDMPAFTLCQENNLPIIVFDMNKPGNLMRLIDGEPIGTLVKG